MERGPVIIEAAINGNRTKEHNPNTPRSHAELVEDTLAAMAAGAAIIHNHGSIFGDPREVADDYLAGWLPVFAERPDALLYPTANFTANGLDFEHLHLLAETGLMKVSLCDPGSTNLGGVDPDGLPVAGIVYANSYDSIRFQMDQATADRVGPSLAIYEPGFLRTAIMYWRAGRLPKGTMIKLYLSTEQGYMGAPSGFPPRAPVSRPTSRSWATVRCRGRCRWWAVMSWPAGSRSTPSSAVAMCISGSSSSPAIARRPTRSS